MIDQEINVETPIYPRKPEILVQKDKQNKLLISLLLFIATFYFISGKQIDSTILFVVCIFIHELGHFICMKIFKYDDTKILFIPFLGGLTIGTKKEISQKQQLFVLFAGPVPGIIIGLLLLFIGGEDLSKLVIKFGLISLALNIFNLLPIVPLDGGRIIETLYLGKNKIVSRIFIGISIVLFTFIAIIQHEYFLLVIPFFLLLQIVGQIDLEKVKVHAEEQGLRTNTDYEELTDEEYWKLRDEIGKHARAFAKIISPFVYEESRQESKVVSYIQTLLRKPLKMDLTKSEKFYFTIFWLAFLLMPIFYLLLKYNLMTTN